MDTPSSSTPAIDVAAEAVAEALADIVGRHPSHDWGGGGLVVDDEQLRALLGPLSAYLAAKRESEEVYITATGKVLSAAEIDEIVADVEANVYTPTGPRRSRFRSPSVGGEQELRVAGAVQAFVSAVRDGGSASDALAALAATVDVELAALPHCIGCGEIEVAGIHEDKEAEGYHPFAALQQWGPRADVGARDGLGDDALESTGPQSRLVADGHGRMNVVNEDGTVIGAQG